MNSCGAQNEQVEEKEEEEEGGGRRREEGLSLDLAPQKKKRKQSGTGEMKEALKLGLRKTNISHCGAEMLL